MTPLKEALLREVAARTIYDRDDLREAVDRLGSWDLLFVAVHLGTVLCLSLEAATEIVMVSKPPGGGGNDNRD